MNSEYPPETIKKILKNKKKLETGLNVMLEIKRGQVSIEGKEPELYIAEQVLEAINKNFDINVALLLTNEEYVLEDIHIKDVTKKKNLEQVRARIIGTKGKTLKTLSELTECYITLHENTVSIIGPAEKIKEAVIAIENLIRGSKQSNVYKYLERQKTKPVPEDLGLKETKQQV